jgi:hypothetical protein
MLFVFQILWVECCRSKHVNKSGRTIKGENVEEGPAHQKRRKGVKAEEPTEIPSLVL